MRRDPNLDGGESIEDALQRRESELQGGERRRVAHQRARMILPSAQIFVARDLPKNPLRFARGKRA